MVRHRLVATITAVPAIAPLVVTLTGLLVAIGEIGGSHPMTIGAPRSVAEAIAMRDPAAAVRLVESGASATEIGLIRPGILGDRAVLATPLEAAVIVDQAAAVDFLASRGVELPASLACLAADVGARQIGSRVGEGVGCRAGEALREVLARP